MSKNLLQSEDHLPDEEILRFIDGELSYRAASRVRNHLKACWTCRVRRDRLQRAIDQFVGYQCDLYNLDSLRPPGNWLGFNAKLLAQAEQATSPAHSLAAILRRCRQSLSVAFSAVAWFRRAAVSATVFLLVWAGLVLVRPPAVSSRALLERSSRADRAVLTGGDRIVHRSIALEERLPGNPAVVHARRIEIWQNDAGQSARRAYSEQGELVAAAWIDRNGLRVVYNGGKLAAAPAVPLDPLSEEEIWQLAPSADDFGRVTGSSVPITVSEEPASYELSYRSQSTSARPRLIYAKLTLRRGDLHAISQDLRVEQNGAVRDYRFVETSYQAQEAAEVAASIFRVDVAPAADFRALSSSDTQPEPFSVLATADLEVDVLDRLDRASALRGEIQVERLPHGPVRVAGVVAGGDRRRELLSALGPLAGDPALQVRIETIPELDTEHTGSNARPLTLESAEVSANVQRPNADLERYLRQTRGLTGEALQAQIKSFTYEAVDHLAEARMEALFLCRLIERFPAGELENLSPRAREQWRAVAQRHAGRLDAELRGLHGRLAPVFRPASNANVTLQSLHGEREWRNATAQILTILTAADKVVWKALAASSDGAASAQLRGPVFWQSLETAGQLAVKLKAGLEH